MDSQEMITVAILAKDKAHVLPMYLSLIERQTFPASQTKLYIRTNNNNDRTAEVLEEWVERVKDRYDEIFFDKSDVEEPVQNYAPHAWNNLKLQVLVGLRQKSIEWARERGTHYFIADCDNFISSITIETLLKTGLPVIGPLLRNVDNPYNLYSNYHYVTDENGYYKHSPLYTEVLMRNVKGLIEVEVIHCTYLIRKEVMKHINYNDGTARYDYVMFSDTLRKAGIPQYLDNRQLYGVLTFCDTEEQLKETGVFDAPFFQTELGEK